MPEQMGKRRLFDGQARIAAILALLLLVPLGYSVVHRLIPKSAAAAGAFLERPEAKYTSCVRDTEYMRYHHWELLRGTREQVVRYGIRGEITLGKCRGCHISRERFCDQCHNAVSLTPDCFGCHYYP